MAKLSLHKFPTDPNERRDLRKRILLKISDYDYPEEKVVAALERLPEV